MIKLYQSALSLLLAGSVFFSFPAFGRVRANVTIEGVSVGGMKYAQAEKAVREKLSERYPPFILHTPAGDFSLSLARTDDVSALVRRAKKGESLRAEVTRVWVNGEEELEAVCRKCAREATDASVSFTARGFTYVPERAGLACNYAATFQSVCAAIEGGMSEGTLSAFEYAPEITCGVLKERTRLLSSFTTYYDGGNTVRAGNIALAASRIAGTTLNPEETFSFNEKVGKRTEENGFGKAAVILDGEFVPGVGGGVCQASTTLMNAALRAGLEITESRPHSLSVGYVPPSLDAMVSEYSDLKFKNGYPFPVYVGAETGKNYVRFRIYGCPNGKRYETESRVLFRLAPPPAEVTEGEEDKVIRAEKEGLASESYLLTYDSGGRLLSRKLLRRDTYAVVRGKIVKKVAREEEGAGEAERTEEAGNAP